MTPQDYTYLQTLLRERSGLNLSNKEYLIESRLTPLAKEAGLTGISDLVLKLKSGAKNLETNVVEAMTTNETFFFRDKTPFDHFRDDILPQLIKAREKRRSLRIWCAAGSTGQEPYSLAMCVKELGAALNGWRIEILATDISREVIAKSEKATYSQFEVQRGLPVKLLLKYFQQTGDVWKVNADIRSMVTHKQLNILTDFAHLGTFDVIFCRNILIYFDPPTKISVYNKLAKSLDKPGFLALGAAETMVGLTDLFKSAQGLRGFYELAS